MIQVILNQLSLDYPLMGMVNRSIKKDLFDIISTGARINIEKKITMVNALKNVSFELSEGDRLGLVGHNGAGKSSLLKILAGIYQPSSGSLIIEGKVVSTLNLSIGMESDATGIENIISRALLLGMSLGEVRRRLDEIVSFTELGEYINLPVKIYSSGMLTRLAFATVTAMDAEIILMDEMIGAGDAKFIDKAERRLNKFINKAKIVVIASHNEHVIRNFCNKAILLEHGQLKTIGSVDTVLDAYSKTQKE